MRNRNLTRNLIGVQRFLEETLQAGSKLKASSRKSDLRKPSGTPEPSVTVLGSKAYIYTYIELFICPFICTYVNGYACHVYCNDYMSISTYIHLYI